MSFLEWLRQQVKTTHALSLSQVVLPSVIGAWCGGPRVVWWAPRGVVGPVWCGRPRVVSPTRPPPSATHDGKEAAAVVFVQVPAASRWHGVAPASTPDLPVITPPPPDVTHTPSLR